MGKSREAHAGAVSALITFGLRALPVLIIYCMKDIPTDGISAAVPKLLAAAIVFITYKWTHQTLVSILLGTISYMMLLRLF